MSTALAASGANPCAPIESENSCVIGAPPIITLVLGSFAAMMAATDSAMASMVVVSRAERPTMWALCS